MACFKKLCVYYDAFVKEKDKYKMSKELLLDIIDELIKRNDKELDELLEVKDGNTSSNKTKGRV